MLKVLLTYSEVAKVLGVSDSTVKRLRAEGDLPFVKLGTKKEGRKRDNRPIRFRVSDVAKFANITQFQVNEAIKDDNNE